MRCWADRIAVLIFLLIALALGFLDLFGGRALEPFLQILWFLTVRIVLPVWIVLRIVDFIFGGPARRRGQIKATLLAPE